MELKDVSYGLKVTPLYDLLLTKGGIFTEFGGYYMPVNFEHGIVYEHEAVRNSAGLFDISHMGEILLKGEEASVFLNYVGTNNIDKCDNGMMQYQIITLKDGGALDDMMTYKFSEHEILLVCNASNQEMVYRHLLEVLNDKKFKCEVINQSEKYAAIAVQGPHSLELVNKALKHEFKDLKYLHFIEYEGFIISRSGYTGEDGFEIYGSACAILGLTKTLFELGVVPCGLGARDTLRFEAGLPLYGHELSGFISPVQAGLNFALDFSKTFIGSDVLLTQKEQGVENKVYGLVLLDRGIARQGYPIYDKDKLIGFVTSGFMIPGTKDSYANAYLESSYKMGDVVEIEIRNKRIKARIRKKTYLKKKEKRA